MRSREKCRGDTWLSVHIAHHMTFLGAQRAARRGGHRLVDGGRTPNGLYRLPVCERCGGKTVARSPDEACSDITVWSCTSGEARIKRRSSSGWTSSISSRWLRVRFH